MRLPDTPALKRATDAYRSARAELLDSERALLDQAERVAEQRRRLPAGPEVANTVLQAVDGAKTTLSDLFRGGDTVLAYNMMYGPKDTAPCRMCTSWVDGFNGIAERMQQIVPFVVFARADVPTLRRLAASRSWTVPLYSAPSDFGRDIGAEDADGDQWPLIAVFRKGASGAPTLWYAQNAEFTDESNRGIDLLNPLWQLLDLLPMGRGADYYPPPVIVN